MTRLVPVTVLVVAMVVAASGVASAQATGMLPNGATIVFERRQIRDDTKTDGTFVEPQAGSAQLLQYFNLAHCNCAKQNVGKPNGVGTFNYLVRETMGSGLHVGVTFLAGTNCDDAAHRAGGSSPTCTPTAIDSASDLDADLFANGGSYRNFNLYQIVNGNQNTVDCLQLDNANNSIYALVDTTGGSNYDYAASQVAGALSGDSTTTSGVDTKPPPLPMAGSIKAQGGESAIHLTWTPPTSNATDVAYYQALCANIDGSKVLDSPSNDPQFVTTASLCGAPGDPILTPTTLSEAEGQMPVSMPADSFGSLDRSYICGQSLSGTANSLDIEGLTNGTPYQVILLSIDLHGNYTGTYLTSTITPLPSTDFWEDLHGRGSKTEGGLCLLAETYGDDSSLTHTLRGFRDDTLGGSRAGRWLGRAYYATLGKLGVYVHGSIALRVIAGVLLVPLVALALLWHWLTLPGVLGLIVVAWLLRRHRATTTRRLRRLLQLRAVPAGVVSALLVLGATRAQAGGYEPYWETNDPPVGENQAAADDAGLVKWHVGIRVGPYVPDIDKQFGGTPGPYAQMFGGYHVLPMLDVDRMVWSGFGQVGIGLSLGYMQKTARAFTIDSMPSDNPRARGADHDAFRLIPMALTATYRFTWLDDEYGIPLVPYVRGGLSYYVWWISTAAGDFAKVCKDGGMEPTCSQNKALGASLGVQGSIGLAIRAERIDASAALSMRQSGLQHAGVYGELSIAKVDGFGSDTKLSVGDRTWFAGVDFEF
jgi:hypothetical protein